VIGRPPDELGASGEVELAQDVADMVFHGLLGDEQLSPDLPVGVARATSWSTCRSRSDNGVVPGWRRATRRNSPSSNVASSGANGGSPLAARSS
jgi:hypothetical protein